MRSTNHLLFDRSGAVMWKRRWIALSVIVIFIIAVMVFKTLDLKKTLERSMEGYASDVSDQLTGGISSQLASSLTAASLLADHASEYQDSQELADTLMKETEKTEFDSYAVIFSDGTAIYGDGAAEDLKTMPAIQDSFGKGPSVDCVEGQNLLFSVPLCRDGTVNGVFVGVRRKENMQALIQSESFAGKGLNCIVDSEGTVVISPTDLKPFLQLDDIFRSDTEDRSDITKMRDDWAAGRPGVYSFTAVDKSRLIMSYCPLGVNGWMLLTLVPADLLSQETDTYVFHTFFCLAGIILACGLFLAMVLRFYRVGRREMEKAAFTDPLTGGMNEAAFRMKYRSQAEKAPACTHAVIFLNIKNFKMMNENFGMKTGNDILIHIYKKIMENIREGETAARAGADHFFICMRENREDVIQSRVTRMTEAMNAFNEHAAIEYHLSAQWGVCVVDEPDLNIAVIQDRARIACRQYDGNSACCFYTPAMTQKIREEHELNALFDGSVENHDFQIYMQPKVRLSDGRPGGAEVLVRWFHPQKGRILPSEFIPLFEKSDNICRLDLYVFEEMCIFLYRCMQDNRELLPVSVNLSRVHFKNLNFLSEFVALKEKYRIPDGIIEIELTESILFDEQQRELVKETIVKMHEQGFLCSLDDFGVGFSSLALLKDFDIDTIKLDREFFMDITNSKARSIITGFIRLAKDMGIHVVAEGIETQEQIDFLKEADCELVQGYYYSKPLTVVEFEEWTASPRRLFPEGE